MKTIVLKPLLASEKLFSYLEKLNLIKTLNFSKNVLYPKDKDGTVEVVYQTSPKYGTHKLICVAKKSVDIKLTTHPDNEDIILLNPTKIKFKPLYLIIGLYNYKIIEKKAQLGKLSNSDILAIELKYNHPKLSFFTILKNTPHCEITLPGGKNLHPIFFVTEPSKLKMRTLKLDNYEIKLKV